MKIDWYKKYLRVKKYLKINLFYINIIEMNSNSIKKKKKLNKKIINEIKHIKNMKFILSKNINFFYRNILSRFKI